MKHLSEEELIAMYYGEESVAHAENPAARRAEGTQRVESGAGGSAHVAECSACAARFAELQQDLEAVKTMAVPERGAEYGERVWEALRPRLIPYEKKARGRGWMQWRVAVVAAGCAAVLAAAFVGGRYWERITTKKVTVAGTASPQARQRVVLVVLTDHLDRTERLLVSLEHADSADKTENAQLQSEARELLASNRLYRATASDAGDPSLAAALDRLEGVLAEIANDPNLTAADLERVRNEMHTEGILFEIRVLRARGADAMSGTTSGKGTAKGATI